MVIKTILRHQNDLLARGHATPGFGHYSINPSPRPYQHRSARPLAW